MGMGAHINPLPCQKFGRTHLIEKDERPHHLPLRRRQRAAHLESAKITGARHDFTGQLALGPGFRSAAEVEALRRWAFRRFYLRPRYAAGLLRRRLTDGNAVETPARLSRGGLLALRMSLPGAAP